MPTILKPTRSVIIYFCGTRSNEEADGRLRRVLGDGLAAEGGEDRHGYQSQGERRMFRRFAIFVFCAGANWYSHSFCSNTYRYLGGLDSAYYCYLCHFVDCFNRTYLRSAR